MLVTLRESFLLSLFTPEIANVYIHCFISAFFVSFYCHLIAAL